MALAQLGLKQLKHQPPGGATSLQPPVITPGQVIDFGGNTRSGAGAFQIANTGGISTSRTINSGNALADWAVSVAGVVTAAQSGGFVATYTLNITLTNAAGSSTADVGIRTTGTDADGNNLAVSWSASTIDEMTVACSHASLSFGDNILLRSGTYNEAQLDKVIGRAADPVGTWTAPSLKNASQPDQGSNLDTGNFIKVTKHAGASPVIAYFRFNSTASNACYLRFTRLEFYRPTTSASAVSPDTSPCVFLSSNSTNTFGTYIAFDNNVFHSSRNAAETSYGALHVGHHWWVHDNIIHEVGYGIYGPKDIDGTEIIGNEVYDFSIDAVQFHQGDNVLFNWNKIHSAYLIVGGGGHPDSVQISDPNQPASRNVTGVRIVGNRIWVGSSIVTGGNIPQGLFGGITTPYTMLAYCAGNIVVLQGITLFGLGLFAAGSTVRNNTVAEEVGYNVGGATAKITVTGTVDVQYNIALGYSGGTQTDNITVAQAAGGYAAAFANPLAGASVTDPSVNFAPLNTQSPVKAGAHLSYIDYSARTLNFPSADAAAGVYRVTPELMYVGG